MGQLLSYDMHVRVLLYNLNPLPRAFGYLGFGVSYHSYLLNQPLHFPSWIQLPLSLSVTNGTRVCGVTVRVPISATSGTRVCRATVVIVPISATSGTSVYRATVVIVPVSVTSDRDEGLPCYGSYSTGFSYQWDEGLPCYGSYSTGFSYQWDTPDNTEMRSKQQSKGCYYYQIKLLLGGLSLN